MERPGPPLDDRRVQGLGQDVLALEFDVSAAVERMRGAGDLFLGEALQSQRLVAGIGNMWMAEALWEVSVSPWMRVRDASDAVLRGAVEAARRLMQESVATGRPGRPSTGERAGLVGAAARSCAPAARATPTARRTGVRDVRQERGRRGSKQDGWPFARPNLHLTLRSFCLGAFVFLGRALEEGDELPFAFEEHVQRDGPALYEYRPLVRSFVESRASALAGREDARIALDELLREPAAAIFARAHAGPRASEEHALFRTVLCRS